jgi:DNA-binding response OmpR family regulator
MRMIPTAGAAREHRVAPSGRMRTLAVVTRQAARFPLASVLQAAGHPLLLVGSVGNAYLQIRRETPELVIIYLSADDVDGCQLLSALALDRETAGIPVVTRMIHEAIDTEWDDADIFLPLESDTIN